MVGYWCTVVMVDHQMMSFCELKKGQIGGWFQKFKHQASLPLDRLPGSSKLASIVQRTGDKIVISDDGISHYASGTNLTRSTLFTRDSQGRITAIYDPNSELTNPPI